MRTHHAVLAGTLAAALSGCPTTHGVGGSAPTEPADPRADAGRDAADPRTDGGPGIPDPDPSDPGTDAGPPDPRTDGGPPGDSSALVDLLIVIDGSNSMAEEQTAFIAVLPRLVEALMSGDANGDGVRDFRPAESLHIGAISVDLGAGPHTGVPTCREGLGDDAVLRSVESPSRDCPPHPSGIFEFGADEGSSELGALRCVTNVGIRQCGFEQQLEATLKALTPSAPNASTRAGYGPPRFMSPAGVPDARPGHADGINGGFVRDDSVLAILVLTDEEDCSVADYGLFVTGDPRFMSVPLNLRCHTFGDPAMGVLHPVQRYVDGLLGLRRDPRRLVLSGIVGIPPELEVSSGRTPDFASILAHPDMVPRVNAMGTNLVPTCVTAHGVAYPPHRIVHTAAGLSASGAHVTLSSICADDLRPAIEGVALRIGQALGP